MKQYILLTDIEASYKKTVENYISTNSILTIDSVIQLSIQLYNDLKVYGASDSAELDNDMLLFQYGTYDWGDEKGNHTSFDITRQFILGNNEFYQLSFSLIFNAGYLTDTDIYNSWNSDFKDLQAWANNIKLTRGYDLLKTTAFNSYNISLWKV